MRYSESVWMISLSLPAVTACLMATTAAWISATLLVCLGMAVRAVPPSTYMSPSTLLL